MTPQARRASLAAVALAMAAGCSRATPPPPAPTTLAAPLSTPAAAAPAAGPLLGMPAEEVAQRKDRGKAVYARWHCASCHSTAGALPTMKVKPLVGLAARYDVDGLDAWIRAPRKPMPSYPIRDDDRRSLAVYLLTTEDTER